MNDRGMERSSIYLEDIAVWALESPTANIVTKRNETLDRKKMLETEYIESKRNKLLEKIKEA